MVPRQPHGYIATPHGKDVSHGVRFLRVALGLGPYWVCECMHAQLYLILCDPMDCSPPGSTVRGIFQARILEWVAISFSRGPSQSSDQTQVSCISCIGRQILYHCTTWEVLSFFKWKTVIIIVTLLYYCEDDVC